MRYGSAEIVEIIIRDGSGAKYERFKFNGTDGKQFAKALEVLKNKYGFSPESRGDNWLDMGKDLNFGF